MTGRAIPLVSMTSDAPAVLNGKPVNPLYWAKCSSSSHPGPGIHAVPAATPKPYPLPRPPVAPPAPPLAGRWIVDDLPAPPTNGFFWLGDPSSSDGTGHSSDAAHQWPAHSSTPSAPAWRSFFPFKPSVTAANHYLQGGGVVSHPKGVNFNPQFIEHMWLDWGRPVRQPFTWIIAGMIPAWPTTSYRHTILDAGRNPDEVGFPRLTASQCYTERKIDELGLGYRNYLAVDPHFQYLQSSYGSQVRAGGSDRRPRMFVGIFNGLHSQTGYYAPGAPRKLWSGKLANGTPQEHRYYVLGRQQGWMSQDHASHLFLFEIRFYQFALSLPQLDQQYEDLSSKWQFDRYRTN